MRLLLFATLLIAHLAADDAAFSVDAKEMEYDGVSQVLIAKDVTVTFRNGSKLSSRSAKLDFESMKGLMSSGFGDELVVFTGFLKNDDNTNHPVVVKGREMKIAISENSENPNYESIEVRAVGDVEINYDHDYTAYGHIASFINTHASSQDWLNVTSSGVLTLDGKDSHNLCRVEHKNGDVIEASRMSFHPYENKIDGWNVKGTLTSLGRLREVTLTTKEIHWLPKEGYFRLSHGSNIVDQELGSISNIGTLECYQDINSQKSNIKKVIAKGQTRINHLDNKHIIGCFGEMILDHENDMLVMKSPLEKNGSKTWSQQAFYEDKMGKIYADTFEIKYQFIGGNIEPIDVSIEGNVRMHNRYISDPKVRAMLEQYALADKVKYSPTTKEMLFSASKGKRVLYYDKTQGIQLSAPGLFVHRKPNQELEVQGKGNVRLKFTHNEVDIFKEYFPFLF